MPKRARRRAAPWSASTRTAISAPPPAMIDAQIGGLIGKLHARRRFRRQDSATRCCCRGRPERRAARVLLVGLGARAGFGRKQYRKALLSSAQALAKTGAADAVVYLALERGRRARRAIPRAHRRRDLLRAGLPDSRPEDRREAEAGQARRASAWRPPNARAAKAAAAGPARSAPRSAARSALSRDLANLPPNICTPDLPGQRARSARPRSGRASRPRCSTRTASRR